MIRRLFYAVLVIVLLGAGALGVDMVRFLDQPLNNDKSQLVEIAPGTSFRGVVDQLEDKGVIKSSRAGRYFDIYARYTGQATRIKSGEYLVPARQKPAQLLSLLVSGKIRQHHLTLIEGWRFSQIMQAIENDPAIKHTLKGDTDSEIMAAIGHPGRKPEGLFMPDTYMFPRGTTDVEFLKRSYRAMQKFLDKAWKNRADNLMVSNKYQALIMASLIEKETGAEDERARISGVFNRRLKKGMRLQTDVSVIYGMAHYDGTIYRSDLRRDGPYNTYTRRGLPPTPIASPSRASIIAALHPQPGKALYFVSRGDGTHVFSDTLKAHHAAVEKYQRGHS